MCVDSLLYVIKIGGGAAGLVSGALHNARRTLISRSSRDSFSPKADAAISLSLSLSLFSLSPFHGMGISTAACAGEDRRAIHPAGYFN